MSQLARVSVLSQLRLPNQREALVDPRKADAWRAICQLAYAVPNFFAAEVPVQRFNQKENDDVARLTAALVSL